MFVKGYNEMRFIDVVLDHRQTLGHQLSLNFLLSQDDLNPGLQVKNTEICLEREMYFYLRLNCKMFWIRGCWNRRFDVKHDLSRSRVYLDVKWASGKHIQFHTFG